MMAFSMRWTIYVKWLKASLTLRSSKEKSSKYNHRINDLWSCFSQLLRVKLKPQTIRNTELLQLEVRKRNIFMGKV